MGIFEGTQDGIWDGELLGSIVGEVDGTAVVGSNVGIRDST